MRLARRFLAATLLACNSPAPTGPLDSTASTGEPATDANTTGLASTTAPDDTASGSGA